MTSEAIGTSGEQDFEEDTGNKIETHQVISSSALLCVLWTRVQNGSMKINEPDIEVL